MRATVVKPNESAVFRRGPDATVYKMIYAEMGRPVQSLFLGRTVIKPGGKFILHRHNVEEAYYILQGRGYIEVENERYEFEAGDAVFIEANVKHRAFNAHPDEPLEFIAAAGIYLSGCRESDIETWPE